MGEKNKNEILCGINEPESHLLLAIKLSFFLKFLENAIESQGGGQNVRTKRAGSADLILTAIIQ